MSDWEIVRHQVAIAGQVTDTQTGRPIGRAQVQITDAPSAFTDWLAIRAQQYGARWASMVERPDRTRTAVDGHFHFLDLLDGQYMLTASLPGSGSRYGEAQVEAVVSHDAEGNVAMAAADLSLPPTTLSGQLTDRVTDAPVSLAEVLVRGSGERTFSDHDGRYLLAGLEIGNRTVQVSARGYEPVLRLASFSHAGAVQTLDVALFPAALVEFDPTSIAGCRLWLQAEAIAGLSDGDPVSVWPDSSGNDHHATQTTTARQPTFKTNIVNDRPAVRFDGADDTMSLSLSEPSTDHTFFFVYDLRRLGGHNNYLFDAQSGRLVLDAAHRFSPYNIRWRDSSWQDIGAAVAGRQILTWVFSASTGEVFRNGTNLGTQPYGATSLGGKTALGSNNGGNGSRFEGDMVEVIYYNHALSTGDRQQVEQYLSNRYAIPLG